ncbi:MAG: dinitrogenase iron-molybdenum cofactor biosynthesis protein [Deltaproteobacteria bacterium]|nr:dinitrogenase iron-molybdenum cofactor biosynthesis protein [Deltaproteobacteria bacterium]
MKIAVSVWEGRVSPVFDTASRLLVLDAEETGERSRFEVLLDEQTCSRKCSRIQVLGVEVLICGAISRYLQGILVASGIRVIPWVCGAASEVVSAYMDGTLSQPRYLMPGCRPREDDMGSTGNDSLK